MTNDGGIRRGDRRKKNLVRRKPGVGPHGSGLPGGDGGATGHVTASADSLSEPVDRDWADSSDTLHAAEDMQDFRISDFRDPALGLTNVPGHPPQDWAADTGPTHTGEERSESIPAPDERAELSPPTTRPPKPRVTVTPHAQPVHRKPRGKTAQRGLSAKKQAPRANKQVLHAPKQARRTRKHKS